jgi:polyhydroxybutyrate depolymerase
LEKQLPRPIPIVWFYGTRDSGSGPELLKTIDHLVEQNKADTKPAVKTWAPTEKDPTGITRLTYEGGENGVDMIFYRVDEGGHTWPGKYQYSSLTNVGLTSQQLDATEVIWEHLKDYTLPE